MLQSLIKYLAEAHRGAHGFVMDENGNPVERAGIRVKGRDVTYRTTKYGEFWRILLPGTYRVEVTAEGYLPQEVEFIVIDNHPTLLNVTLHSAKLKITNELQRIDGGPYYRPVALPPRASPAPAAAPGLFSSISNSFSSLVSNIFG
ncbi:Carboxypeptidase E [Eumeta japonica]|uniref:Carboxypeptidase E n=1 Tax=Eumeta variegata TaxID=151549 RepID=A0A4C1XAT7_EUMVA|nr:Carboxypeptidase E [Eumeta japonica]